MFGRNQVPDRDLLKTINQKIARTGTASRSRLTVSVQQGSVVLSGNIPYETQRNPIIKAVSRIPGVRNVVDQLRLAPKQV
jgi:osmotically-inducible protein OsmY